MTEPALMTHDEKAAAIVAAFAEVDGPTVHDTSYGRVQIDDIQQHENANTIVVKLHRSNEEIFIVNPPCYRPDANGEIEVNDKMYTYDPVGTVAEVVGKHIGVG